MPKKKNQNKLQNFEKRKKRILIIGGHMTPALAIADELLARGFNNILWVGQKRSQTGDKNLSAEYREVTRREIRFMPLQAGKIWRRWTLETFDKALLNLFKIPIGFLRASYILATYKPDIIISFGGYLAVPIILNWPINKLNKTKVYIHSQTIRPDLSIKLTFRFAKTLFLTWEASKKYYKHKDIKVVGTPLNTALQVNKKDDEKIFDNDLPTLLILGGNQGANTFNRRLTLPVLENYLENMNIIHQTGSSTVTKDYEKALANKERLDEQFKARYQVHPYILPENLNKAYEQASLILSRSGANTVQEIMYKGVPAVLMPIPWSQNNEQLENAKIIGSTGLGKIFEFREGLKAEELFEEIKLVLEQVHSRESFKKGTSWVEAKKQAKSKLKMNTAEKIVSLLDL